MDDKDCFIKNRNILNNNNVTTVIAVFIEIDIY